MASSVAQRAVPMLSQPFNLSQYDAVSISVSNRPVSVSFPKLSPPPPPLIDCGRGDKKTAKGKRFRHSFGNARPRDKKKGRGPPRPPVPQSPTKKDPSDDDGVDKIAIDGSLFFKSMSY